MPRVGTVMEKGDRDSGSYTARKSDRHKLQERQFLLIIIIIKINTYGENVAVVCALESGQYPDFCQSFDRSLKLVTNYAVVLPDF